MDVASETRDHHGDEQTGEAASPAGLHDRIDDRLLLAHTHTHTHR